jgi:serine protease Do
MSRWTSAAGTVALVGAALSGSAGAPVVHGQSVWTKKELPQAVQILRGRGRIGVTIRDVTDDDVKRAKLSGMTGVVIDEISQDSPAEKAGFKTGDVIVEFDGERVRSSRQFTRLVQETPACRPVSAAVMRDGQKVAVTVEPREDERFEYFDDFDGLRKLGRAFAMPTPPAPPKAPAPALPPEAPAPPVPPPIFDFDDLLGRSSGRLGVTVDDLQPQLAEYFGVKDGVLVTSVNRDTPAAKAGLKAGDVITAINGDTISSAADLRRRTSRLDDGTEFTLAIVRDRKTMTVKGKTEERAARRRSYTVL